MIASKKTTALCGMFCHVTERLSSPILCDCSHSAGSKTSSVYASAASRSSSVGSGEMQTAVTVARGVWVIAGVLVGEAVKVDGGAAGVVQDERKIASKTEYILFIFILVDN